MSKSKNKVKKNKLLCIYCLTDKDVTKSPNLPVCKKCSDAIDKGHAETVTRVALWITYGDGRKQEVVLR